MQILEIATVDGGQGFTPVSYYLVAWEHFDGYETDDKVYPAGLWITDYEEVDRPVESFRHLVKKGSLTFCVQKSGWEFDPGRPGHVWRVRRIWHQIKYDRVIFTRYETFSDLYKWVYPEHSKRRQVW